MGRVLSKEAVNLEQIKDDLFSPGNVYWKKTSGEVLISEKADILNIDMINKLSKANQVILIEDAIDYESQKKMIEVFRHYEAEVLISKKLEWRTMFNALLLKHYYNTSASQFELNQLFWKLFSTITRDQAEMFLNRDREYFMRAINIGTSYSVCAFLLGYYDEEFLKSIYNKAILSQMEIGKNELVLRLKEKIEYIAQKITLNDANKEYIKSIIQPRNIDQAIFFEKQNGSGLMNITVYEMSDLELILATLGQFYHFNDKDRKNILAEINEGVFGINRVLLNLLKRNFEIATSRAIESA